jgi:hypothetical protein
MLEWLINILKTLISSKFYGKVEVCFEGGKITHINKHETMKPPK